MALPFLGAAALGLLRRYGLKKIGDEGKKLLKARTLDAANAKGKTLSEKQVKRGMNLRRAGDVAGNALSDAGTALSAKMIYDYVKDKPEKDAIAALKERNPKLYKKFMESDEASVSDWLKYSV